MSLETWKREYYPFPASDCDESNALEHSLRKWRGLRRENLDRHGLQPPTKTSRYALPVLSIHCSLCLVYQRDGGDKSDCWRCPLYKSRGGVQCDHKAEGEDDSPYAAFIWHGDPEPMIAALEKAGEIEG